MDKEKNERVLVEGVQLVDKQKPKAEAENDKDGVGLVVTLREAVGEGVIERKDTRVGVGVTEVQDEIPQEVAKEEEAIAALLGVIE